MLWIAIISVALAIACPQAGHAEPVSFNRDIRPIMSDKCFHCHGFDASTREAGMRLDLREGRPDRAGEPAGQCDHREDLRR